MVPFIGHPRYEHTFGDICSTEDLNIALQGITDVVLLAGLVGDPITKKYPKEAKLINELGVRNVIELAEGRNVDRFIFISCSNYGLIEDDSIRMRILSLNFVALF